MYMSYNEIIGIISPINLKFLRHSSKS